MKTIQIYDPAMCCSSGVCGTEVDQALVDFATDAQWAAPRSSVSIWPNSRWRSRKTRS